MDYSQMTAADAESIAVDDAVADDQEQRNVAWDALDVIERALPNLYDAVTIVRLPRSYAAFVRELRGVGSTLLEALTELGVALTPVSSSDAVEDLPW